MKKRVLATLLTAFLVACAVPGIRKSTSNNALTLESAQIEERNFSRTSPLDDKTYVDNYDVMTICDLFDAPVTSGIPDPTIDRNGLIQFSTPGNTIAYQLYQKSFVLDFDLYFDHLPYAANFWIAVRANTFTRANYVPSCYVFRMSLLWGEMEIYKADENAALSLISSTGYFNFQAEKWYTVSLASVMTNKGTMILDLSINGQTYSQCEDLNPYTHDGMLILTADGDITPRLVNSSNLYNNKIREDENTINTQLFFMHSISSVDKSYEYLRPRMLNAVNLDGVTIEELNKTYYALDGNNNKIRAVDMYFENNVLNLVINKKLYTILGDSPVNFEPSRLEVSKTSKSSGLESDQNHRLLFDYHLDLN